MEPAAVPEPPADNAAPVLEAMQVDGNGFIVGQDMGTADIGRYQMTVLPQGQPGVFVAYTCDTTTGRVHRVDGNGVWHDFGTPPANDE